MRNFFYSGLILGILSLNSCLATVQRGIAEEDSSSFTQSTQNASIEKPAFLEKIRVCNDALREIFQLERGEYYFDPRKESTAESRRIRRLPDMGGQYPGCTPENQQKICGILKKVMPSVELVLQTAGEIEANKGRDTDWIQEGLESLKTFVEQTPTQDSAAFWEELGGRVEVIRDGVAVL